MTARLKLLASDENSPMNKCHRCDNKPVGSFQHYGEETFMCAECYYEVTTRLAREQRKAQLQLKAIETQLENILHMSSYKGEHE